MVRLVMVLNILYPAVAFGGWVSGGGFLFKDAVNPWFMGNTSEVSYCVEVEEKYFGQDRATIVEFIDRAFGYWQRVLTKAGLTDNALTFKPSTATEFFNVEYQRQKTCNRDTQVKFYFGGWRQELAPEIKNPRDFVALTYRRSYDPTNLRSKGYIYFAPQSGPLSPASPTFNNQAWSICGGCLLEATILHEVGHIFGVSHIAEKSADAVTSESFVETITHINFLPTLGSEDAAVTWRDKIFNSSPFQYNFAGRPKHCQPDYKAIVGEIFRTSTDVDCLIFVRKSISTLKILATNPQNDAPFELGELHREFFPGEGSSQRSNAPIRLWTTCEQRVFTDFTQQLWGYAGLIDRRIDLWMGTFNSGETPGVTNALNIKFKPFNNVEISGLLGNENLITFELSN